MKSTSMTIQTAVEGAVAQVNCQELPSGRWRYTVVKQRVRMIEGSLVPTDAHYIAAHGERATKLLAIAAAQSIADRGTVQKKRRT